MQHTQPQVSLFYRPKWRKHEATELAAKLAPTGLVRFRESRHFNGPEDVEFKAAKVNMPRINYDRVLVLAGSPQLEEIVTEYKDWGVEVEVVSLEAPPADEAPRVEQPGRPDYRKMKKAELRQSALDLYGKNLPLAMKVGEIREWLDAQPWPPLVPAEDTERERNE